MHLVWSICLIVLHSHLHKNKSLFLTPISARFHIFLASIAFVFFFSFFISAFLYTLGEKEPKRDLVLLHQLFDLLFDCGVLGQEVLVIVSES